jgi:hypothetical protein
VNARFCQSGQKAEEEGEYEGGKGNGKVEEGWRKRQGKR